jgi:CRP-like cAMP-binding protein
LAAPAYHGARKEASGEVVFHREDSAESSRLTVRGRFGARVATPLGESVLLDVLGPGQAFGELALLLPDERRSATISALEATVLDAEELDCRGRWGL